MVQDESERWPVRQHTIRYAGPVFTVATDLVEMPDGSTAERDLVQRPGAVAVLPYDQDTDRVLLLRADGIVAHAGPAAALSPGDARAVYGGAVR